ncbi:MAG: SDR family oxidoreductase [Candidatus Omnitrophota bacterium]|jgi:NAD(P)-dependent dehydrogenase (short-subunit alcohol dehydrogenase family)
MGQVVILTGASRGLGLSLAKRFLDNGDRVFGVSRTRKYWKEAFGDLPKGALFSLYELDVTEESSVKKFVQGVFRAAGRIDLAVNAAGYGGPLRRTEDLALKEFRKILDGNLVSAFLVCKYVLPLMRRQKGGTILNVSSMAGQRAVPRLPAYSASKFGVIALSQAIAKENSESGIRCWTVCPGGMNTRMRADLFGAEDAKKQQSPDFVADVIMRVLAGEIPMASGADIVIRHGKVTAIHTPP